MEQNVFIYRNTHRNCWSIRSSSTKKVVAHAKEFLVEDAQFKVSQAGRERVIREKKKNVHAGIQGKLISYVDLRDRCSEFCILGSSEVTYNPYLYSTFVGKTTKLPVYTAKQVIGVTTGKVFLPWQNLPISP